MIAHKLPRARAIRKTDPKYARKQRVENFYLSLLGETLLAKASRHGFTIECVREDAEYCMRLSSDGKIILGTSRRGVSRRTIEHYFEVEFDTPIKISIADLEMRTARHGMLLIPVRTGGYRLYSSQRQRNVMGAKNWGLSLSYILDFIENYFDRDGDDDDRKGRDPAPPKTPPLPSYDPLFERFKNRLLNELV